MQRTMFSTLAAVVLHAAAIMTTVWRTPHHAAAARPTVEIVALPPPLGRVRGSAPLPPPLLRPLPPPPTSASDGLMLPDPGVALSPRSALVPDGPASPTGSQSAPYAPTSVDQAPILLAGAPPEYPDLLRRAGIQGRVLVEAVIDTAGRVDSRSVRVLQSAHAGFEEPARRYVLAALFRPARVAGRPVAVRVRIPIDFTIRTSRLPVR